MWLIGAVVCLLAANHRSNCSLTRAIDGRIVRCGIISSCQSAATSVKALLVAYSCNKRYNKFRIFTCFLPFCLCVAGVVWFSEDGVDLAKSIAAGKQVTLAGLYCHEGQSYYAHNAGEIRAVGDESAQRILNLANRLLQ